MEFAIVALFVIICITIVYFTARAVYLRIVDGDRRSIRRGLLAASIATACAFVVVYWSAWCSPGQVVLGGNHMSRMDCLTSGMRQSINEYAQKHGHYPESLQDILEPPPNGMEYRLDPWGHFFQYVKTEKGFRLFSLGRDGKPGGTGLDGDFDVAGDCTSRMPVTLFELAFEGVNSLKLFIIAVFSSLCAGLAGFIAGGKPRRFYETSWWPLLFSIAGITFAALLVAAVLIMIYMEGIHH